MKYESTTTRALSAFGYVFFWLCTYLSLSLILYTLPPLAFPCLPAGPPTKLSIRYLLLLNVLGLLTRRWLRCAARVLLRGWGKGGVPQASGLSPFDGHLRLACVRSRCVYQLIVRGTRINLAMKHQLCTAGGYAKLVSTTLYSSTWHCRWPFPSTLLVQHLPHISRHPARTKRPLDFRGESTFLGKTCTFTHLEEQPIIHWQHQRRAGCSPFLLSYFLLFGFANETLKQYHSINATRPLDRLASHLNSLIYGRFFVPFLLNKI